MFDDTELRPSSNAEKMAMECDATTMDVEYRFWQAALIDTVIRHSPTPGTFWEAIDKAKRLDDITDRDDCIGWYREVVKSVEEDTTAYEPFTDQTAIEFDQQQQYFDNLVYQRQDTEEACKLPDIPWQGEDDTFFRMPGMLYSAQLTFWKPVAINFLGIAVGSDHFRDNRRALECTTRILGRSSFRKKDEEPPRTTFRAARLVVRTLLSIGLLPIPRSIATSFR